MRTFVALAALLLLAPLVDAPARADELGKAWKLLEAGDRERAKETAAVSLAGAQNAAERGEAFFILALCEPDGSKFAKYMEQFLSDFPGHPLTWRAETNLGMYHYALGNYGRASKHFRKASGLRTSRREEVQSLYWLGLSLLGGGKPGEAREHFDAVKRDDAGTGLEDDAALGFADCLREEGKYSAALSEYRRIVARYRRSEWQPSALYGAGVCLEKLQKSDDALEMYSMLAREFPSSFEAAIVREKVTSRRVAEVASPETGGYTVQLGAFSEEANANGLVARLQEQGITDVRIVKKERGGRILYMVHLGEFPTKEAAESKGKELSTRFGLSYGIVPK